MSQIIDGELGRELARSIGELNVAVGRLSTRIDSALPFMEQQTAQVTHGLMAVDNRVATLDSRYGNMELRVQRLEDHQSEMKLQAERYQAEIKAQLLRDAEAVEKRKKEEKEETDRRITTNRWLIGTALAMVSVLIAVSLFLLQHVKLKP